MSLIKTFAKIIALCASGIALLMCILVFNGIMLIFRWAHEGCCETVTESYNKVIDRLHEAVDTYRI